MFLWWHQWQAERRARAEERNIRDQLTIQRALHNRAIRRWHRENWPRLPPPEGWQPGFNVNASELEVAWLLVPDALREKMPNTREISRITGVPLNHVRRYHGLPATEYEYEESSTAMLVYHITPSRNLSRIRIEGLFPRLGRNARASKQRQAAVFCYTCKEAAEAALDGWLGERFDEDLAIVELNVSGLMIHMQGSGEVAVQHHIPHTRIRRIEDEGGALLYG